MSEEYYKITNFDKKPPFQKKYTVYKKIMCRHIVNHGNCSQGTKCHFAHSLDEQVIEVDRKIVYDMIDNNINLSHIDLNTDKQLYETLKILTTLCSKCIEKHCSGGYNCRTGACTKKYQVCERDLNYGFCNIQHCGLVHLSKKGLKPYKKDDEKKLSKITVSALSFLDDIIKPTKLDPKHNNIKKNDDELIGKLLTKEYFSDNNEESDSDESLYSDTINENEIVESDPYSVSIFM